MQASNNLTKVNTAGADTTKRGQIKGEQVVGRHEAGAQVLEVNPA